MSTPRQHQEEMADEQLSLPGALNSYDSGHAAGEAEPTDPDVGTPVLHLRQGIAETIRAAQLANADRVAGHDIDQHSVAPSAKRASTTTSHLVNSRTDVSSMTPAGLLRALTPSERIFANATSPHRYGLNRRTSMSISLQRHVNAADGEFAQVPEGDEGSEQPQPSEPAETHQLEQIQAEVPVTTATDAAADLPTPPVSSRSRLTLSPAKRQTFGRSITAMGTMLSSPKHHHQQSMGADPVVRERRWAARMDDTVKRADQHQPQHVMLSSDRAISTDTGVAILRNPALAAINKDNYSSQRLTTKLARSVSDWKPFDPATVRDNEKMLKDMQNAGIASTANRTKKDVGDGIKSITVKSGTVVEPTVPMTKHVRSTSSDQRAERKKLRETRTRNHPLARSIAAFMTTRTYLITSVALTILSLFAKDFDICWLPKDADLPISIILCAIFCAFLIEIAVTAVIKENYLLSYMFWLDLVGTLSLVLDIDFMVNLNSYTVTSGDSGTARVAQSATVIRVTKFVRLLRVLRFIRIVRLFKFSSVAYAKMSKQRNGAYEDDQQEDVTAGQSNRVGQQLSELIDKRVVFMMLGILVAMPLLTSDPTVPPTNAQLMGLEMLQTQYTANDGSQQTIDATTQAMITAQYLTYMGSTLIYYQPDNSAVPLIDQLDDYDYLRSYESVTYTSTDGAVAMCNIRDLQYQQSAWSMALTLFVIVLFILGNLMITRDVHALVIAPLERMTVIIRKLTGTLAFLQRPDGAGKHGRRDSTIGDDAFYPMQGGDSNQAAYETHVIENMIDQLAHIFAVQPNDISGNVGQSKAMQMMAGSKHTEIVTGNSVVSIEVVERPREPSVHMELIDQAEYTEKPVDINVYHELSSLDTILANPIVLAHFKLYMKQNVLAENLAFWSEVDRFRSIMKLHTLRLYHAFIAANSTTQINIPATQRDKVKNQLDDPSIGIFDQTQAECLQLMKGTHRHFLESKFCQMYMKKRAKTLHLQGKKTHKLPAEASHVVTGLKSLRGQNSHAALANGALRPATNHTINNAASRQHLSIKRSSTVGANTLHGSHAASPRSHVTKPQGRPQFNVPPIDTTSPTLQPLQGTLSPSVTAGSLMHLHTPNLGAQSEIGDSPGLEPLSARRQVSHTDALTLPSAVHLADSLPSEPNSAAPLLNSSSIAVVDSTSSPAVNEPLSASTAGDEDEDAHRPLISARVPDSATELSAVTEVDDALSASQTPAVSPPFTKQSTMNYRVSSPPSQHSRHPSLHHTQPVFQRQLSLAEQDEVDRLVNPQNDIDRLTNPGSQQPTPGFVRSPSVSHVGAVKSHSTVIDYNRDGLGSMRPSANLFDVAEDTNKDSRPRKASDAMLTVAVTPPVPKPIDRPLRRMDSKRVVKRPFQKASIATSSAMMLEMEADALFNPKGSASLAMPGGSKPARPSKQQDTAPVQHGLSADYLSPTSGLSSMSSNSRSPLSSAKGGRLAALQIAPSAVITPVHASPATSSPSAGARSSPTLRSMAAAVSAFNKPASANHLSTSNLHRTRQPSAAAMSEEERMEEQLALTIPGYNTIRLTNPTEAKRLREQYANMFNEEQATADTHNKENQIAG